MGIDTRDFIKGLKAALTDNDCVEAFKAIIVGPLHEEIADLKKEITVMKSALAVKEDNIKTLEKRIQDLEVKADCSEQYSRRNSLRIHGLPEDNRDVLKTTVSFLNDELGLQPPLQPEEIDRVHRIGQQQQHRPRSVILKLATYRTRHRIYSRRAKLRESSSKIYINEDLTKFRSELFWNARKQKRNGKLKDAWTHDGNIMIRSNDDKVSQIKTEDQLLCLTN